MVGDLEKAEDELQFRDQPLVGLVLDALVRAEPAGARNVSPVPQVIATEVGKAVEEFLRTAPPLPREVLSQNHTRLAYYLCERVGVTSSFNADGVIDGLVQAEMLRLAHKYYYTLPTVVSHLKKAQTKKQAKLLDDMQNVFSRVRQELDLEELQIAEALTGGWSGSIVVRVYYRRRGQNMELGVFKWTESRGDFERECDGQEAARISWMAEWVEPTLLTASWSGSASTSDPDHFVLVTPLAFPPSPTSQIVPTLHDLIRTRRSVPRCQKVVSAIGKGYADEIERRAPSGADFMSAKEFFLSVLNSWQKPSKDGVWGDNAFWTLGNLPLPRTQCFQDGDVVVWNPLWLIKDGQIGGTAKIECRRNEQHGDLNARNVMVPADNVNATSRQPLFRLIDFEKWSRQSAVLDPCWLALAIMEATAPSAPAREFWGDLSKRFVSAAVDGLDQTDVDSGSFQLGLTLVARLFEPLHRMSHRNGHVMQNTMSNMLLTTLGAAGLASAYYSVRALDTGPDVRRPEDVRYRMLSSLFGFRVAALCLNRLEGQEVDGHPSMSTRSMLDAIFRV